MTPIEWLLSGDTGISSETICAVMTGSTAALNWSGVPHDPSDFGRCYRLLQHFPEWESRLGEVAHHFPEWKPLVDHWPELKAMYEEAIRKDGRRAGKMYKRMQELRKEAGS